ncbi:MAG: ATP-binding protein [Pseudomonadota bacterium]
MAFTSATSSPLRAAAIRLRPRIIVVTLSAAVFAGAAVFAQPVTLQLVLGTTSLVLTISAFWTALVAGAEHRRDGSLRTTAQQLLNDDDTPCFVARPGGGILFANRAAARVFAPQSDTLAEVLSHRMAFPGPFLARLEDRARERGAAHELCDMQDGPSLVTAHRTDSDQLVWRMTDPAQDTPHAAGSVPFPAITVGQDDAITDMNGAARGVLGDDAHHLNAVFPNLPIVSGQPNMVVTRDGMTEIVTLDGPRAHAQRSIYLLPDVAPAEHASNGATNFNALPVPLLRLARDGEIRQSNALARRLLGQDDLTRRRLSDFVEGLGRSMTDWLGEAAEDRGGLHSEFLRVKRDDKEVFVQVTLNRTTEDGRPMLIAVLNDATEHKSLEAQFVQSQKMQAIGQLAGGVAHDFNNLLTAITGHCDLLLLRHDQGDGDYADLMQINQNANRAAALVSQLLAYSRKQTLRPEVMDLRDMLSDLTHLLNRLVGEKVILTLIHDPLLWSIRADKRQLEQVLMNLVVNARDAIQNGGDIRIRTENVTLTEPLHRDRAVVSEGRYVRVSVEDQGQGIPPEKLTKVFEPFYTTKRTGEGTGLGLSTAYGIVKQTGGFIFVDSTPNVGTTFQLLFPAYDPVDAKRADISDTPALTGPSDGVVLLVEDEAPVRAFASRALKIRGLTVLEADSAEAALDLLKDDTLHVDVFVSDVVMPRIDGPSWVQQALKQRPGTRVVFMSGYAAETFGEIQSRIPNSVFLPKPFSLKELTDTVQAQLSHLADHGPAS